MDPTVKLTALDLLLPRTWTRWTLHFAVEQDKAGAAVLLLEQGLDRLLMEIPLLGGFLKDSANGKNHFDLVVANKCPQFLFSTRNFTDNAADFEANQYPLAEYPACKADVQVFAAQANVIEGGIALAFIVHHSVMDGVSMSLVLRRWSEHCLAISGEAAPPLFLQQCLDRSPLLEAGIENVNIAHPAYRLLPEADVRPPSAQLGEEIKMPVNLFAIDVKALTKLKRRIMAHLRENNDPEAWISTNDTLIALLWTSIIRARLGDDNTDRNRQSRWNGAVDVRSKMNPPLLMDYMGCAAVFSTAQLPMVSLSNSRLESLAEVAFAVRQGIKNVNDTYIRALISFVDKLEDVDTIFPAPNFLLGDDVIINSWLDFGLGEFEWGEPLGNIVKMRKHRYPSGKGYDGLNTVLPRKGDGGIDVIVSLREEHMENLMQDNTFLGYATLADW